MMRKKQISRMLIGAFVACMAAACSNETEVLNGLPTDGNTLSVNLRTNDIGAATRAIATEAESEVTSLSAYLFDENNALEKVYKNLTPNSSNGQYTVALTHIENRGPKTIYFVANGADIKALSDVEGTTETAFQALLMDEMTANPETPLTMTAKAELTEWAENVNNAQVEAALERVSARIDLQVDAQQGLSFTPTGLEAVTAANSYIFPNEAVCEDDKTVTISGTTLYPYESAADVVKEVKVTGNVTIGETVKEVTFTVPFVNEKQESIAIERNHRYTVHITRINGFFAAEATVTVSDWSAADASGNLKAGEELIMTATEFANETLATEPAATAVYPTDKTKSVAVALTAADAKVYKIYVGSANIEAETSWNALPEGWTITAPADTRAEYLWEKSYWTLTIPANESQDAKSFTIKAVNKLELAKDADTEKFVEITFTQEGKEEEVVDHSKNPLLIWAEYNSVRTSNSGSQSTAPTSGFTNNLYGVGSYYQWGRNYGFANYNEILTNGYFCNSKSGDVIFKGDGTSRQVSRYTNTNQIYSVENLHYYLCSVKYGHSGTSNDWITGITGANSQYWNDKWEDRTESYTTPSSNSYPLPYSQTENWRLPTKAEAEQLVPTNFNQTKLLNGTLTELHEVNGVKVAMKWLVETHSNRRCLVIKALVVPDTFKTSDLTTVDWNNENVKTRVFPGNGHIEVQYGKVDYYGTYGNHLGERYFVIPLPYGNYGTNTGTNMTTSQYPNMWLTKDCNDGRFGGFWTSESDPYTGDAYLFTYMLGGVDGTEYWIKVDTEDKDDAYSVRGVKTVTE